MTLQLHSRFRVQNLRIGREQAPLAVIDDLVANADELIDIAAGKQYADPTRHYPGIRAKAPLSYQQFVIDSLRPVFVGEFGLDPSLLRFTMCHFSLVTTSPDRLETVQRIPHVDSLGGNGLATIHYLFRKDLGGTAFYRHRATGFESLDELRRGRYFAELEQENTGPNKPGLEYINGDTPLFEQIARQDGVFNRMLIYRRNSLHSGCIGKDFTPDPDPRTGRLSINSFIG